LLDVHSLGIVQATYIECHLRYRKILDASAHTNYLIYIVKEQFGRKLVRLRRGIIPGSAGRSTHPPIEPKPVLAQPPAAAPTAAALRLRKNAASAQHFVPPRSSAAGVWDRCLAVTYFRMGKPHTIIGAERFHFRVRDGIGWFPLAMATRQSWLFGQKKFGKSFSAGSAFVESAPYTPKPLGCYMVKPHGQLVLVSFTHYCASTPSLSTS
jgi:hypothetical protein